jgi:hypothetical protein
MRLVERPDRGSPAPSRTDSLSYDASGERVHTWIGPLSEEALASNLDAIVGG